MVSLLSFIIFNIITLKTKGMKPIYYNEFDESDYDSYEMEERTYERYNGSYAQDVEGWSDQDIDDVFDGDPDAYWNID